jgi:hypothetical protein
MAALEIQTHSDDDALMKAIAKNGVTPELIYRLNSFFELMPPMVLRDHLIELYHNYIQHEYEALPYNFNQLAENLPLFLDFLKFAEEERNVQVGKTTTGEE